MNTEFFRRRLAVAVVPAQRISNVALLQGAQGRRAAADDVAERIATSQLLAQLFDLAEVTKGLHSANWTPPVVPEYRGGDADGDLAPPGIDDDGGSIDHRFAGLQGVAESAPAFTDAGVNASQQRPPIASEREHKPRTMQCCIYEESRILQY